LRALRFLFRVYSFLVLTLLAVSALAMSAIIASSASRRVSVGWLPWSNDALGGWLACIGIGGIAVVLLAVAGRLQWLMTLFAAAVAAIIIHGLFFSAWKFDGMAGLSQALWIAAGLVLAVLGAVPTRSTGR
jgi:hypothetical protein